MHRSFPPADRQNQSHAFQRHERPQSGPRYFLETRKVELTRCGGFGRKQDQVGQATGRDGVELSGPIVGKVGDDAKRGPLGRCGASDASWDGSDDGKPPDHRAHTPPLAGIDAQGPVMQGSVTAALEFAWTMAQHVAPHGSG